MLGDRDHRRREARKGGLCCRLPPLQRGAGFDRPQDFTGEHRCWGDAAERGRDRDVFTVSAELDRTGSLARAGGVVYLHTLTSAVPTAANASYCGQIVVEKTILRGWSRPGRGMGGQRQTRAVTVEPVDEATE